METLLAVALIGVCTPLLIAIHLHLTTPPPKPVTACIADDINAEFFRIIDREWLGESDRSA